MSTSMKREKSCTSASRKDSTKPSRGMRKSWPILGVRTRRHTVGSRLSALAYPDSRWRITEMLKSFLTHGTIQSTVNSDGRFELEVTP